MLYGYESYDEECWQAIDGSREAAAAAGAEARAGMYDPGATFEIRTAEREDVPLSRIFPRYAASSLLDSLADSRHDEGWDDDWPEFSGDQEDDLQRMLTDAFVAWVHRHGLSRPHWKPKDGTFHTHVFRVNEDGDVEPVEAPAAA